MKQRLAFEPIDSPTLPEACQEGGLGNDFGYTDVTVYKPVDFGQPQFESEKRTYQIPSAQSFRAAKAQELPNTMDEWVVTGFSGLIGAIFAGGAFVISRIAIKNINENRFYRSVAADKLRAALEDQAARD